VCNGKVCADMGLGWYYPEQQTECNASCDVACVDKVDCGGVPCLNPNPAGRQACILCPYMNACGDGICQPARGETCQTCPQDGCCPATKTCGEMGLGWYYPDAIGGPGDCERECGAGYCVRKIDCDTLRCTSGVPGQDYCYVCPYLNRCGDGACQPAAGENCGTCPGDCCPSDPDPGGSGGSGDPETNSCASQGFRRQSECDESVDYCNACETKFDCGGLRCEDGYCFKCD
jgi:hypothetical protein